MVLKILKNILVIILLSLSVYGCLTLFSVFRDKNLNLSSNKDVSEQNKIDFSNYSIENLSTLEIKPGEFQPATKLEDNTDYVSYLFHFRFNPSTNIQTSKTTSGQLNLPISQEIKKFPVIIMLRGYINQESYKTGDGSRNAAGYFAKNGFITVAPDFLGYGLSDKEAGNIFETRFQTYITVLSLIKSLDQIPNFDNKNIFLWGHSNGGQIALTTLEITGGNYPTVLWAPVSKQFPYSILYYTDQSEDGGKLIRSELSKFEENNNVEDFSLTNYISRINGPIQLHQGYNDDAVPKSWSDLLVKNLENEEKDIEYFTYPKVDHNMSPQWNLIIQRSLVFFESHLIN